MEQPRKAELDPAIIELARRGDTRAFAQIVQRYQAPVYNLAYRMLGNAADAEDAAQETFLRVYAQLKHYRADQKFASWLLSIAAHYCIDRLRRRKFQWISLDEENVQDTIPARTPDPEQVAFMHEREEQVQQLLQKLSPAARAVVVLKYWNDLEIDEIASMTGDSASNVKVKLFRARQAMARELKERNPNATPLPQRLERAVSHAR